MAGTKTTVNTLQSNIKKYDKDFITNYSIFLGGLNVTQKSLEQYDPLKTGYARIFFIKMPVFMQEIMPNETRRIRHLLEYGFTSIQGIGNVELETATIEGGYAGKSFEVGTVAKDGTTSITIGLYEFAGSPVREYTDMWINGISDAHTGLGHYHGAIDQGIKYAQYNHVAEAIYIMTDPTGRSDGIEYACLLTNMIPKQVKKDHFNYEAGDHQIVKTEIEFTVNKYESPQINEVAKALIDKFRVMENYMEFNSEYTQKDVDSHPKYRVNNWPSKYNQDLTNE